QHISVYPNPSSSIINVLAPNEMYASNFQIINQVGQVLVEGKINSKNQKIEVNSLSSGFYSLRVSGNLPQSVSFIKE
ncbi:MAG: T9SS type A sorting domain-containing protein, partial [Crocinitomicaceae bacterium]